MLVSSIEIGSEALRPDLCNGNAQFYLINLSSEQSIS
jgi:hypothetical protein